MIVIGIDPATACGYAIRRDGVVLASGVWNLKPKRHEGAGMRWLRLRSYLTQVLIDLRDEHIELLAYEEVRRHLGTDAAHLYAGCVTVLQTWCEDRAVPYTGIPVGTVKKLATGSGRADKEAMVLAAQRRWPEADVTDDNQADALWIAEAAMVELGVGR